IGGGGGLKGEDGGKVL
ncbi:hypothetical protein A2U01_0086138, partial [Trifolium medium]|nr:hypothetical protein [Trifolium medium]